VLRRWWAAGRPARRALAVLWSTGVLVGVIAVATTLTSALRASPDLLAPLLFAFALALICAPFAILTGLLRVRLAVVAVQADDGTLLVQVSDDGIGGADPARGAGLRGLRDRVAAIGGTLHIHTRPDRGTLVEAELPCG